MESKIPWLLCAGEASEVLAFLVMCLIYLLTLGLGSLNPIDFSDHVSSGGQVA